MEEDRIVVELFLEKPNFNEVTRAAKALEGKGIKPIVMPPEDRGINTHLIIEAKDAPAAREALNGIGMVFMEKEVIIIKLENKPGTMAEAAKKISDKGINLLYAFSVTMNPHLSYVLLGSSDNVAALEAIKSS
jgi:hypothetical protein